MLLWIVAFVFLLVLPLIQYIRWNDKKLCILPPEAATFSPSRLTNQGALETFDAYQASPHSIDDQVPPKTGRRYIVVGGAGFLGGWMVIHLLHRGEDPSHIRIVDIHPPTRKDLTTGPAKLVDFKHANITDARAVMQAFDAPWPSPSKADEETTIFHTASIMRPHERHPSLLLRSSAVNITGTQNVIDAAIRIGATALLYTSSGSVCVKSSNFFLNPFSWSADDKPKGFVQMLDDDEKRLPRKHEDFSSNYSVTKLGAEELVKKVNGKLSGDDGRILRTGCLRPGNGMFGPGGDMLCGAYLTRQTNPTWFSHILASFMYVENCSLAHLCYEARLLELSRGSPNPDISGQSFTITDPGPPRTYSDVYTILNALTDGATTFPYLSPTLMLVLAQVVEIYHILHHFLSSSRSPILSSASRILPPITGDLINLQPSLFSLTTLHLVFDDRRARLSPSKGGLGYRGVWTTLEGCCKLVEEFRRGESEKPRNVGGGLGFFVRGVKSKDATGKVTKVGIGMDAAVKVLN
ncbi:hypothetical protein JAAARDRAFT_139346 [Jaapia argillacea MUCL 33604]|uniref:3-beta hydroxysteroid dehydrogenase/isomerase domain-containing protein n=1 Tax=Jaapia argillacea MUCL 33604 TaxID=933084 RepID=A0A067PDQ8_9AGAM|nr:hypothetical protein JAAARDRAFT_139346 [Jaapia argillacea MUCL 33604]